MKGILPVIFYSLFVIGGSSLFSQTKIIPFQELPTASGFPSGSGVFFGATMTGNTFTVSFSGPSDRWLALGLGSSMSPADVFIYSCGKPGAIHPVGWNDYFNSSGSVFGVNNDPTQNWNVISTGTVLPAQRNVTASRLLNTGDINDVAISINDAALNVVWAFGATPDYTIAYHGVNNRAYLITLPWLSSPTASFSTASNTVCAGSPLAYSNLSTGGQTTYTWNFQGGSPSISTSTNPSVTYALPGTYSVALTASNAIGTNTFTQVNYITVTPTVAPTLSISILNGTNPKCDGTLITFTNANTNGGSNPTFMWKVNGINTGVTTSFYSSSNLANGAVITCVMNSNAVCAAPVSFTSAAITLTVNSTAAASATIGIIAGNNPMCSGTPVTFSVSNTNGGTNPVYQWNINGVNSGNTGSSFSSSALNNGDVVNCVLSSNAPCASSTLGVSAGITMTVSSLLVPSVSLGLINGNNPGCAGTALTYSATPLNGGATPAYQWQLNGVNVGLNNPVYSPTGFNNGALLSCVLSSALSCASPNTATSSVVTLSVIPLPATPTIITTGPLSFCSGGSGVLSTALSTGNLWSNGTTTQSIVVSASGSFSVTQSANTCTSLPSQVITVTVHALPSVALGMFNSLCVSDATVQLTQGAPTGGSYSGTGVSGGSFSPPQSGVGVFIISYGYTDNNGCTSSANSQITVDACLGRSDVSREDFTTTVFPNPTAGELTINTQSRTIHMIRILDLAGKEILRKEVATGHEATVDISHEPAGLYILEAGMDTGLLRFKINKKD